MLRVARSNGDDDNNNNKIIQTFHLQSQQVYVIVVC